MSINIAFTFLLSFFLFSISKEDIETMLINENKLRLLGTSGFLYLLYLGISNEETNTISLIQNSLFSMIIVFLIMYSISYISYKVIRINSLGLGDIKLSSVCSIWLGIELSLIALAISFTLSAFYSIYGKINKKFKIFHQYPFAPFLSIGIFFSWLLYKI